jgi:hypothetical protein
MSTTKSNDRRKPTGQLTLVCPRCSAKGAVRWDRLDRPLRCRGCSRWYRVEGSELIEIRPPTKQQPTDVAAAQSGSTSRGSAIGIPAARKWQARKIARKSPQEAWLGLVAIGIGVCAVAAIGFWWMKGSAKNGSASAASGLPVALAERAPLFTEAWSTRQVGAMAPFVAPGEVPGWKDWLAKTVRPAPLADVDASDLTIGTVAVQEQADASRAVVDVQVVCRPQPGAGPLKAGQYIQRQVWQKHGQDWYFQPAETLTAMARYRGR